MNRRVVKCRAGRAGWIMLDMITGLIILLVLIATFSAALLRQQRGQQKLADTRAAVRVAEQTATALQLGLTSSEIEGVQARLRSLLKDIDRGKIKTF